MKQNQLLWVCWYAMVAAFYGCSVEANAVYRCTGRLDGGVCDTPCVSTDASVPDDTRYVVRDAGSAMRDARTDTGRRDTPREIAPPPTEPYVSVLETSTCSSRRLGLTNDFAEYARIGMTVWHLCYETPEESNGGSSDGAFRPIRVRLVHYDLTRQGLIEDAIVIAPREQGSWSANLMMAASSGFPALFNLALIRQDGETRWAVDAQNRGASSLALVGRLRLWRVSEDGTQTATAISYLCQVEEDAGESQASFFVPQTFCPATSSPSACGLPSTVTCRPVSH
ncbi:MAG: hypothetical protein WCV84_05380 [Patescibacteria group bacterium]